MRTEGSTSQAGTTEREVETTEAAEDSSSSGEADDTTGSTGSTGTTGTSGTGIADTTGTCPAGTLGCACDGGNCEPLSQCLDGVCVPQPSVCIVSYGGTVETLEVQVTRVLPGGVVQSEPMAMATGAHAIDDDTAGQDMLVECGGTIYAAAVTEGAVHSYGLDDGMLIPLAVTSLLDRTPRALECARPGADHLAVFSVATDGLNNSVAVQSYARDGAGRLDAIGTPLELAALPGPLPPRRVRTAWGPDTRTAYAIFDVDANSSTLTAVSVDAGSGMLSQPATGADNVVLGIQARLGGLDYEPPLSQLVLTGGQTGGPAGVGNFVRFETNAGIPSTSFVELADVPGETFFADSSSVQVTEVGEFGRLALVGSSDGIGVVSFAQDEPVLEAMQFLDADGEVTALSVFDGSVLVVVDAQRVRTLDALRLSQDRGTVLDVVEHGVAGYTTSVLAPCSSMSMP